MAENAVPGKGVIAFGKKADSTYVPVSLASDGSMNISGSITASLGAFNPLGKATRSAGITTTNIALPTADKGLVLINTGANDAYFKLGTSSGVVAAVTDFLIKSGCILGLDATGYSWIAAITATGSTSIDIWTGTGLISAAQAGGSGGGGGNVNLNQVGGVSIALGQTTKSASLPMTLASDQGDLPANITKVGGAALALGQTTKSASVPVALASDQGNLPVAVSDRLEVTGTISSAAVLSNFPVTDTSGYRSMALQVTVMAAASNLVVEESNDGSTWTNLPAITGAASISATGLYGYNFSAKQIRARQSVYGGSGSSTVTAELRLNAIPFPAALGAGATDTRTNRVVLASDDLAVVGIGGIGDTAWVSGNGSIIALLKGIFGKVSSLVTGTVLAAGSALIGKVSIDQTTPGTTDSVTVAVAQGMGLNFGLKTDAKNAATDTTSITAMSVWKQVSFSIQAAAASLASVIAATAASVSASAFYVGLRGTTANPSAVSDGQMVGAMADKMGRQVVILGAVRDLVSDQVTSITGTGETTIVTAGGAGVLNDLVSLKFTNSGATPVEVILREDTAGTIRDYFYVPAGDMRGVTYTVPFKGASNKPWTAQASGSTTSLRVTAQFVKNI